MPCFLRRLALVGGVMTLVATSASLAAARDTEAPPPQWQVSPTLVVPREEPKAAPAESIAEPAPHVTDIPTPVESSSGSRFYGWQNMLVSYAGVGLFAATLRNGRDMPIIGAGIYALGSPIVHIAHGQYLHAAGSLVLNVLTPVLFGAIAHSMDGDCRNAYDRACGFDALVTGVLLGVLSAPLIDGLALGWDDEPRRPPPALSVQPTVTIARKEASGASTTMVGLAGAF